jgi:hypothetical protein
MMTSKSSTDASVTSEETTNSERELRVYNEINGHMWYSKYLKNPTWCDICTKFVYGFTPKQQNAFKCQKCKLISHHDCYLKYEIKCEEKPSESSIPKATPTKKVGFADVVMESGTERGYATKDVIRQTGKVFLFVLPLNILYHINVFLCFSFKE